MVYGGGGAFGIAFGAGVAKGLQTAGIPVSSAPALGTSAGSWVASIMALDLAYHDFDDVELPPLPTKQLGALAHVAHQVFGAAHSPLVSAAAFRVKGGRLGRVILHGDEYELAEICAASSAAPGMLPKHTIDGTTYLDGGVRSGTSVGCAADGDHVIVIAPMAKGVLGVGGQLVQVQLDHEIHSWSKHHIGRRITLITPDPQSAKLAGTHTRDLFDSDAARLVYPLALAQGEQWGEALQLQAAHSWAAPATPAASSVTV